MADKSISKTLLGRCNFRGDERRFGINQTDRRQHMYVIGKTGTGKTTLLENMALQDIRAGHGLGIIDPHGEFVERILAQIPADRAQDVVYFNPVDTDYPIGFNILDVPNPEYKHLIVSDLMGIFTKIWANVWSARMEYIMQNCILALLDTPNTTLLGVLRILVDKNYRQQIIANVTDPVVRSFWTHEYESWRDQFRNEAIVPIQNKVGQFLNTPMIRNIVGQPKSRLNVPDIMNSGKIFLVNVSKGRVGEDNSQLLGAMIITKVQLAAMERVRIPEDERRDFYLYVDEFQNFATDSFASILSEARKYRLNLTLAHQYIGQLVTDVSTKVRDAVFGNVGTMISFRVGAVDAEYLEKEFTPEFVINDLIGLPNHHIYLKMVVGGVTSRPFSAATLPPIPRDVNPAELDGLIELSRKNYGAPRQEVEEQIERASGTGSDWGPSAGAGEGRGAAGGSGQKFEAICSNCGKTASLPFKPDGRRPVYCSNCLKQIEEGTLIPLPERMPQASRARFSASLGDLGIEFAATPAGGATPQDAERPRPQRDRRDGDARRASSDERDQRPPHYDRDGSARREDIRDTRVWPEPNRNTQLSSAVRPMRTNEQRPPDRERPLRPAAQSVRIENRPAPSGRIFDRAAPRPQAAPSGRTPMPLSQLRQTGPRTPDEKYEERRRARSVDLGQLRKVLGDAITRTPEQDNAQQKNAPVKGEGVLEEGREMKL